MRAAAPDIHPTEAIPAIVVRDLRASFARRGAEPVRALDGVSLTIARAERVALLGPNGSGKSTLLGTMALARAPDEGELRGLGEDLVRASGHERRRYLARLAVVFQGVSLDPLLTIRENWRTHAALWGFRGDALDARAADLADRLGLADRLDDRVRTLSGGLARRADLARALLTSPDLLLLDEPTAGLDLAARADFLDSLDAAAHGATVVMTTHQMDEAERFGRVVLMDRGRVVADDAPSRLRAALGGHVVRVGPHPRREDLEARLVAMGLTRRPDAAGGVVFGVGEHAGGLLEQAGLELARSGIPFEMGPPTLGDAYLALTGRRLVSEPSAPMGKRGRHAR